MNRKNSVKKTAALLLGLALAVGAVGCKNFIITDNEKDLAQTVAKVDISAQLAKDGNEYKDVAADVATVVKSLSTEISKRDLIAYFLSTGYQYVESYGYTYEDTFNMLMDGLVSREIMMQYAIAYYLKNTDLTAAGCADYVAAEKAKASEKEKELLDAHPEVLTLKYFLTEGGKDETEYKLAVYNLKKSLNTSLDSLEQSYIKAEAEEHDHATARTLPNGVTTEKEDYYTENYEIYTARNNQTLDACGEYEKQEGSTTSTRQKAYNAFLANLQGYSMIGNEDTADVTKLSYYYVELSSALGQALINKYFEDEQDSVTAKLDETYVQAKYDEIYKAQENSYKANPSAFATAMGSVSDTSFLLYGLDGFGYVYNILLPFSSSQNVRYTEAKNNTANDQDALYTIRKNILAGVKAKDLRDTWISAHDHANYSYEKDGQYYFFEDNFAENSRYEKLKQYLGKYAYNGTVAEEDDELVATANEIYIDKASTPADKDGKKADGFIEIMESYIDATLGREDAATGSLNTGTTKKFSDDSKYYTDYNTAKYTNADDEMKDYSSFIYYTGKVNGLTGEAKDYFNAESDTYKAVSAVNELMFAYSTDTGCLNTYFGYAVSPYKTDFVKEFEYAAQEAIRGGVGSYVVCATDYGWHIVYASFVYKTGDVYGGYKAAEKETEGSFSNLFYESLKTSAAQNYSTEKQNEVLNRYNNDDSVSLYKDKYKDLLEMDK